MPCGEACRPRWMEGSATLTMVTSSRVMNPTTRVTASARQRCSVGMRERYPGCTPGNGAGLAAGHRVAVPGGG